MTLMWSLWELLVCLLVLLFDFQPNCTSLVLHCLLLKLSQLSNSSCLCQETYIHRSSNIRYLWCGLSYRWPVITEGVMHTAFIQYSVYFQCVLIKLIEAMEHLAFRQENPQSSAGGCSCSRIEFMWPFAVQTNVTLQNKSCSFSLITLCKLCYSEKLGKYCFSCNQT